MNLQNLKIISNESFKLIFIIAFVISICCNIVWLSSFNNVQRGIDVIYQDLHDNHIELINKLDKK